MMRYLLLPSFCLIFSKLICSEFMCPAGCGVPEDDPKIRSAIRKLKECITESGFMNKRTYPDGGYYDYTYIYLDTLKGEKKYNIEFISEWRVSNCKNTYWNEDADASHYYLLKYYSSSQNKEENYKFLFRSVKDFHKAFEILERDSKKLEESERRFCNKRIEDLQNDLKRLEARNYYLDCENTYFGIEYAVILEDFKNQILDYKNRVSSLSQELNKRTDVIASCKKTVGDDLLEAHQWCIDHHSWKGGYYQKGLIYYERGDNVDAFCCLRFLIENYEGEIPKSTFLALGETENELGQYENAIHALSKAISLNPSNKEAYLARAEAYFGSGDFESAFNDYLSSGFRPQQAAISGNHNLIFSAGIIKGLIEGGVSGGINFFPSLISSMGEISHGLWAFASDPANVSQDFIEASIACIQFVKEHTPVEIVDALAPELSDLIKNWNEYEELRKGELTGFLIGKYGVELFAGVGISKSIKVFRDLKRANNLLTFEAMTISKKNRSIIQTEALKRSATRKQILSHANLQVQLDKQGKHIPGHKNYDPKMAKSIFLHNNPQKLIDVSAGKGFKVRDFPPGQPGYKEIVDFGEFIGYAVDDITKQQISTSWGVIHYAKDGVHIVPTKPRK